MSRQNYQNILIETQIFPPIQTLIYFKHADAIHLEIFEHYQKRSFRNRYHIGSSQGRLELSIPLKKGKNNQMLIGDVQISYEKDWRSSHWKAIQSSYGKSAFYVYYKDAIRELFENKYNSLLELNLKTIELVQELILHSFPIKLTTAYHQTPEENYLDLRSKLKINTIDQFQIPEYFQVFSASTGFISQLSILDLLFHLGPEALVYIQQIDN